MPLDAKPQTLADVLVILTDATSDETPRRRTLISAIHRVANFLHRPPCDIPADVKLLRQLLLSLHPAQCEITPKSLSNLKSELAAALRLAGVIEDEPKKVERSSDWINFFDNAKSGHQRWGLSRFADYCCSRAIEPSDVTQDIFDEYECWLDEHLLTRSPATHCKSVADTWNHLLMTKELSLVRLRPKRKRQYAARSLMNYPESMVDEIESYLDRLSHEDIFAEDAPDKPLRPTSLRNVRAHIRQYLDALVNAGADPASLIDLRSAISADQIKIAFRAIQKRRGKNDIPSGLANIAATLTAIARHHLKVGEDELRAITAIKRRVSSDPRGMSAKNSERLGQFSDWKNVVLLISLAPVLLERANKAPASRTSALSAMHAASLAILLSCPMRAKNLASLDLERHLRPHLNGSHTTYGIRIEGTEVKNGEPIEIVLSAKMSKILHRYIAQFRPLLSDAPGTALFPRLSDGKPRTPDNFSKDLSSRIKRETGLDVHTHLFRHFAAFLYLKERPGDFETVRRLLKHKRLQTTMDFYAALSNQWAHDHYDKVVLEKYGAGDA